MINDEDHLKESLKQLYNLYDDFAHELKKLSQKYFGLMHNYSIAKIEKLESPDNWDFSLDESRSRLTGYLNAITGIAHPVDYDATYQRLLIIKCLENLEGRIEESKHKALINHVLGKEE